MGENLSEFALRERTFFENNDLALLMLRRWLPKIALVFGLPFLVAGGLLAAWLAPVGAWLMLLVLWWTVPLWERVVVSQAGLLFFHPEAGWGELARSLARVWDWELLRDLLWGRFSFYRAFRLPVRMFERPDKARRADRTRWLGQQIGGRLFAQWILSYLVAALVYGSIALSVWILASAGSEGAIGESPQQDTPLNIVLVAALLLAMAVSIPLHCLACFGHYLNRRTIHEGWDIKLALQRLRRSRERPRLAAPGALLAALGLFLLPGAQANLAAQAGGSGDTVQARIERTLADGDFGGTRTEYRLELKHGFKTESSGDAPDLPKPPSADVSAAVLRIVVFTLVGSGVVVLAVYLLRQRRQRLEAAQAPVPATVALAPEGHEQRRLDLAEGLAAWQSGDRRLALACLYRTGISFATKLYKVKLPESATEGRCQQLLERSPAPAAFVELFRALTKAWVSVSWSRQDIDEPEFMRLHGALLAHQGEVAA